MNRDAFKSALCNLVDEIIPEDRELTDDDEGKLIDNFPDVAQDIFEADDSTDEDEKDVEGV